MKKGIILGKKISAWGIEVDNENMDVVERLPPPRDEKAVISFLGHARFYRRFINDFSKIARPLINLLAKDFPFHLNSDCLKAFEFLKGKLMTSLIILALNYGKEFELIHDAKGYAMRFVLRQ